MSVLDLNETLLTLEGRERVRKGTGSTKSEFSGNSDLELLDSGSTSIPLSEVSSWIGSISASARWKVGGVNGAVMGVGAGAEASCLVTPLCVHCS